MLYFIVKSLFGKDLVFLRHAATADEKFHWITTASIPGLVGTLAVPTIVSMLISALYNMADTFFVGNLGTSAQGAVGIVFSLMAIIQALGFTFGQGSGNYVSRLLGQRRAEQAEQVAATGFFTALMAGTVLTVLGLLFLTPLVRFLGATDSIFPYARDYTRFILLGAPFMAGSLVLNNLLRFEGSAFYGMLGISTGAILNIALDPILIFALNLGTAGAALATVISQLVSFCILVLQCGRGGSLPIRPSRFSPSLALYRDILKNGLPSFCRQSLTSVASICLNLAARPYGDAAIAAMTVVSRITAFASSALIGFGQGFQPVCGFNFGATLYSRVRQAFWFCVKVSFAVLAVLSAVGFLFAPQIVLLFQKSDPLVVSIGARALRFQCLTLPCTSWVILNNMMLQTCGESFKASILAMARQGLFFLPVIWILPLFIKLLGIQLAQPIADLFTLCMSIPMGVGFLQKLARLEQKTTAVHTPAPHT